MYLFTKERKERRGELTVFLLSVPPLRLRLVKHLFFMAFDSALDFLLELEHSVGLDEFPKYRQEGAEKSEYPFLLLFVCFTLLVYVMETYLDLRQHGNLKAQTPPPTLLEVLKTVDEDNKDLEAVSKVTETRVANVQGSLRPRCGSLGPRRP